MPMKMRVGCKWIAIAAKENMIDGLGVGNDDTHHGQPKLANRTRT